MKLDENNAVIDASSASLFDVSGTHVLVTAAHGAASGGRWAIQVKAIPPATVKLYAIGALTAISKGHLGFDGLRDIDLAMTSIPTHVKPIAQVLKDTELAIKRETARTIIPFERITAPNRKTPYGFAGLTQTGIEEHRIQGQSITVVGSEPRVAQGLTYTGDRDGDAVFTLPYTHPGHEYFKGCSGAPIMDESRHVVGIVSGGCTKTNAIISIPLLPYRTPLLIEAGRI